MYWNLQNYTVNTAAYYQAVPKLSSNGKTDGQSCCDNCGMG